MPYLGNKLVQVNWSNIADRAKGPSHPNNMMTCDVDIGTSEWQSGSKTASNKEVVHIRIISCPTSSEDPVILIVGKCW